MASVLTRPAAGRGVAAPPGAGSHDDRVETLADRIASAAVSIVVGLVALQTIGYLVGAFTFEDVAALDADIDASIWSWLSVGVTFVCAFLLLAFAVVDVQRGLSLVIAVPVAFLSLDDMLRWHERVSAAVDPYVPLSRGWPIVYLPLLVALFLGLWRLAADLSGHTRRFVHVGALLLAGAVVLELLSAVLLELVGDTSGWYTLQVAVEEASELAGWALVASGLLAGFAAAIAAASPAR